MKKIIAVDSGLGRTGSSAMMGLLKIIGVNLGGKYSEFYGPNPLNKKGYFELKSIETFLKTNFSEVFSKLAVPTIGYLNKKGTKYKKEFERLILNEFGKEFPIGIKFGKGLLYPILNNYPEVYTLVMQRNIKDQSASILRMWRSAAQHTRKKGLPFSEHSISEYCKNWNNCFETLIKTYTNVHYKIINFYTLINKPVRTVREISEFIGEICPEPDKIKSWIEPSMVRKK
jgi:hypothetical protein